MSKTQLPKIAAQQKQFDLERENAIRKRILKDFNKRRDDFSSLLEYNDYLEEVEDIIYNLVNEIDVEETNNRVRVYKQENKKLIRTNMLKKEEEERQKKLLEQAKLEKKDVTDQSAASKAFDPSFVPSNAVPAIARLPKPKQQVPSAPKYTDDPSVLKRRMVAGGYRQDYPLLRARFEADQTVF